MFGSSENPISSIQQSRTQAITVRTTIRGARTTFDCRADDDARRGQPVAFDGWREAGHVRPGLRGSRTTPGADVWARDR